jgi:hypothetical protein
MEVSFTPPSPMQISPVRSASLIDRVRDLHPGHVIDVSNMDAAGKGARVVPEPKTSRGGKYGVAGIPIISNNSQNYVLAMQIVYGADAPQRYAARIAEIQAAHPDW